MITLAWRDFMRLPWSPDSGLNWSQQVSSWPLFATRGPGFRGLPRGFKAKGAAVTLATISVSLIGA